MSGEKLLMNKKFRISINVALWLIFIGLVICAIIYVSLGSNKDLENTWEYYYNQYWPYIISFFTIFSVPLNFLKIRSTVINMMYTKKRMEEMAYELRKEDLMKKNAIEKAVRKNLDRNADPLEKVVLYCKLKGRKLVGTTFYDVKDLLNNTTKDSKTKRKELKELLIVFGIPNDEELLKFVNNLI